MEEFSISDPWRFLNPSGRAYSFFSNVHHTFTRIDYFLIDNVRGKPRNLNQKRTQTRPKAVGTICPSDVAGREI